MLRMTNKQLHTISPSFSCFSPGSSLPIRNFLLSFLAYLINFPASVATDETRLSTKVSFLRKRKIASTLTFLGGCFAATDIKLCGSLPEAFLTRAEDLPKRNNPCLPCVSGSLPRDTVHNRRASDYSLLQFPQYCK